MAKGNSKTKDPAPPICSYCGNAAVFLENSGEFYHGRDYGPLWACRPCAAWVTVEKGTRRPLGRLADATLRRLKIEAHAAFDPLVKERAKLSGLKLPHAKAKGYRWLASQLEIEVKDCHIAMMDEEQCRRVVEVCRPHLGKLRRVPDVRGT